MSQRQNKKLRQFYRRDLRAKLGLEVNLVAALLKQKPKYYPSWLWRLGARLYFTSKYYNQTIARAHNSKKRQRVI